jgi:predicted N-formylglutamate amidohydrolase
MKGGAPSREQVLVTCEHGGNRIPAEYRPLFTRHARLLATHRGYDPGALALARLLAAALRAPLLYSTTSRLLVDLNRSASNPSVFSDATRGLPAAARIRLIERHHLPYRRAIDAAIERALASGRRVVHVSCHSFTPRLAGRVRGADIGLLFDPRRATEARLCAAWRARLLARRPALLVRRNYPYRGTNDGVTTALRRRHPDARYAGIEIEVNQKYPRGDAAAWRALRRLLVETFAEALFSGAGSPAPADRASRLVS